MATSTEWGVRVEWFVRATWALFVGVVLGGGGLLFGSILAALAMAILVLAGGSVTPSLTIVLGLVFIQGVGCIGVGAVYATVRPRIARAIRAELDRADLPGPFRVGVELPGLRDLAAIAVGYVLALVAAVVGTAIVARLQVDTGTNQAVETALEAPEVLLILIPASFLLIGPGEELLFRGVVQGRLREVFSPVSGILLASLVFALLHFFALTGGSLEGNLAAAGLLTGPAVVLGAAYEYTDNIVVPSLIHGLYNATLFTLLYVSIAYADELEEAASAFLGSPL